MKCCVAPIKQRLLPIKHRVATIKCCVGPKKRSVVPIKFREAPIKCRMEPIKCDNKTLCGAHKMSLGAHKTLRGDHKTLCGYLKIKGLKYGDVIYEQPLSSAYCCINLLSCTQQLYHEPTFKKCLAPSSNVDHTFRSFIAWSLMFVCLEYSSSCKCGFFRHVVII